MLKLCRIDLKEEKDNLKEYVVQIEFQEKKPYVFTTCCSSDPSKLSSWYHDKVINPQSNQGKKQGMKRKSIGRNVVSVTACTHKFGVGKEGIVQLCAIVFQIGLNVFVFHCLANGGVPDPCPTFLIKILDENPHVYLKCIESDILLGIWKEHGVKIQRSDSIVEIEEKSTDVVENIKSSIRQIDLDQGSTQWTAKDLPSDYILMLTLKSWCTCLSA